MNRIIGIATAITLHLSCSSVRQVVPLEPKQSAVSISLGGPITQVGDIYIPLPLLSFGYNYGLSKHLEIGGGLHITQALYGILELEASGTWRPFLPRKLQPGLMVAPGLFIATDFSPNSFRLYPALNLSFYWQVREQWYPYAGLENWFELTSTRDDGIDQPHHWLIIPHAGCVVSFKKWQFQIESKLYTPNLNAEGRPVKNVSINGKGVVGVFVGVGYQFGSDPVKSRNNNVLYPTNVP